MVTHIVFWALKDEAEGHSKRENAEHIKEMLEALVGVVPGLIEAKVGINANMMRRSSQSSRVGMRCTHMTATRSTSRCALSSRRFASSVRALILKADFYF